MKCGHCGLRVETEKNRTYKPPSENKLSYWEDAGIQNHEDIALERIGEEYTDEFGKEWQIFASEELCINCGNLLQVHVGRLPA